MTAILLNSFFIFCLRLTDVSLGTIRTIMIVRGRRLWAALIGFVEITIWVVAISRVLGNLTHIGYILGYSGGFAVGTLVGMSIADWLAIGYSRVQIITPTAGDKLIAAIRQAGHGATLTHAEGRSGSVRIIDVVLPAKQVPGLVKLIRKEDPKVFITIDDTPQVLGGYQRLSK